MYCIVYSPQDAMIRAQVQRDLMVIFVFGKGQTCPLRAPWWHWKIKQNNN